MWASTRPGVTRRPSRSNGSPAGPAGDPTATMRPSAIDRSTGSTRSGRRQLRSTRSSTRGQYADFCSGESRPALQWQVGGYVRIMPSFTRRLRQEAPGWVRDGVVNAQQAEAVLARYPEEGAWFLRPISIL